MNLIFDFDGTLIDSFKCAVESFNLLADKYKFCKVESEKINDLKKLNSNQIIQQLKIPIYKLPTVLISLRENLNKEITKLLPYEGITNLLQELKKMGCFIGIVTSNSAANVNAWLQHNQIEQYFDFLQVESGFFSKSSILKSCLKKYQLSNKQTYYIGDETRDIEAALAAEINSIAVTWGFNNEEVLLKYSPTYIARTAEGILDIISK